MFLNPRNVAAFCLTALFGSFTLILAVVTLMKLHCNDDDKPIAKFFRIFTTICTISMCISSVTICANEGLFLFGEYFKYQLIVVSIVEHGFTFLLISIIFIGRLYFSFENTNHRLSNKVYIFLLVYFAFFLTLSITVSILVSTTHYITHKVYTVVITTLASIFVISATSLVLLFIYTMQKVCFEFVLYINTI